MNRQWILLSGLLLYSAPAFAAEATPPEVMSAEVAHEQQVKTQLELLQQQRNADFLKQLEAEALLEEQRLAKQGNPP